MNNMKVKMDAVANKHPVYKHPELFVTTLSTKIEIEIPARCFCETELVQHMMTLLHFAHWYAEDNSFDDEGCRLSASDQDALARARIKKELAAINLVVKQLLRGDYS